MNREIKFRAWDKENGCMIGDDDGDADFRFQGGHVTVRYCSEQFYEGGGEIHSRDRWEDADVVVMQYTGLKDKNGTEGYHKDIVRAGKKLFTIEWQAEEARFLLDNAETWQTMDMLGSLEIVGNIYEHPHLINHPL